MGPLHAGHAGGRPLTARTPFAATGPALHPAAERQRAAADPFRSTWLSANAGSGKTRVLTDRVARLLLAGTDPGTILCLTYTKAAAAQMQERLFARLGRWSMLTDAALRGELVELGPSGDAGSGGGDLAASDLPHDLPRARRLFAQALETPGGLKIQTIHAFCAGLLRRFPLEAGVSPQFRELEDEGARLLRAEVAEEMAMGPHAPLVDALARHAPGDGFDGLLADVVGRREAFAPPADEAELRALLGLEPHHCEAHLLACVAAPKRRQLLRDVAQLCAGGTATDLKAAEALAPLCAAPRLGLDALASLEGLLLHGEKPKNDAPFSARIDAFPTKALRGKDPALTERLHDLMREVEAGREVRLALGALARTQALHAFGAAFVALYEERKLARGLLDFDDLIARARRLLTEPGVAPWVLYRLDGGVDHILVDEAQDTSPGQWAVVERLADEFAAGEGARAGVARTIFVVGDRKQSIFSFQGADAAGFDRMRRHFGERLGRIGKSLEEEALEHSFRSASAVLHVVDRTFEAPHHEGLGDAPPHHVAFHDAMPGRVDLWPPEPKPAVDKTPPDWTRPVDATDPANADLTLARRVASAVAEMVREGSLPARGPDGAWLRRPVTPGDVLILVRKRGPLFTAIIRALKASGLEVAGADRLKLGAELAVRDVEATLRFLALPQDDLSLACALKSPLFGWTEAQLYALAQPRPEGSTLWQALSHGPPCEALAILDDLRSRADFLRPYELMSRLLVRHDGRRRLLARLGEEAEEGLDVLLARAMAFEAEAVPSLTGFLEWLGAGETDLKRQLDAVGDRVRVMTAHGAKGLEAPIVILPDTAAPKRAPRLSPLYPVGGLVDGVVGGADWGAVGGAVGEAAGRARVLWAPNKPEMPRVLRDRQAALLAADAEERRRLLYVAMTRAESWLVVCAAGETGPESWHGAVQAGLVRAGAAPHPFDGGMGLRYDRGGWEHLPMAPGAGASPPPGPGPSDARLGPVPPPPARAAPLAPSDLGGPKALAGEAEEVPDAADPPTREAALARGTLLHLALEHLARLPEGEEACAHVEALMAATEEAALAGDLGAILDQARALVAAPGLAFLWGPGVLAEGPLTAEVPPLGRLHGTVDRLLVGPDTVTAVDFKSNRVVPARPEDVPEGILRQMGAYAAMLHALYPGREVRTQVLWTRTATLMELPVALVMAALRRAGS